MEPRSTDTRLIRTPALYGQFRLSRQKAHIFSLKLTRFIRTPVNADNGHFSVSRVTNSHILSTPQLRTLVICTWYFYTKTSTPIDCLSTYFYRSLVRKTVCFGFYIDKTCVLDVFSDSPLNTDTRIIQTLCHVPLVFALTGFHCNLYVTQLDHLRK